MELRNSTDFPSAGEPECVAETSWAVVLAVQHELPRVGARELIPRVVAEHGEDGEEQRAHDRSREDDVQERGP